MIVFYVALVMATFRANDGPRGTSLNIPHDKMVFQQFETVQEACQAAANSPIVSRDATIARVTYDPKSTEKCCQDSAGWLGREGVKTCVEDPAEWECARPVHMVKTLACKSSPAWQAVDP